MNAAVAPTAGTQRRGWRWWWWWCRRDGHGRRPPPRARRTLKIIDVHRDRSPEPLIPTPTRHRRSKHHPLQCNRAQAFRGVLCVNVNGGRALSGTPAVCAWKPPVKHTTLKPEPQKSHLLFDTVRCLRLAPQRVLTISATGPLNPRGAGLHLTLPSAGCVERSNTEPPADSRVLDTSRVGRVTTS